MRDRINAVRQRIASADPRLAFIGRQFGMFSMLPLSKEQVLKLRTEEAIYMADSGRFNVVGMGDSQIDRFITAVIEAPGHLIMADRDPGKVSSPGGLARGREAGADQPRDGPDRGRRARSGQKKYSTSSARAATTWRRLCSGFV